MNALSTLLLLLAAPVRADKSALSLFLPVEKGCEWRIVSLPSMRETAIVTLERCPEKVVFLGDQAIVGTTHELWIGDWRLGRLRKVAPPLPLPARGRLDKIGFDGKGRPIVIISDPLARPRDSADAPGLKEGATHLSSVQALENDEWKPILRERVAFGRPHVGIESLSAKVDWSGISLAEKIVRMSPLPKGPRLTLRDKRVFSESRNDSVYLMPPEAASKLEAPLLKPSSTRSYYATLALEAPYRYVVAKVEDNPVRYVLPEWFVDIDLGLFLDKVEDPPRETPGVALDTRDGFLLTSDRIGSRWPRLFRGRNHWSGLVYEQPSGQGAVLLP